MHEKQTNSPPAGMALGDIYYIVFRHKWKIALISATGVLAALLLPLAMPVAYQSEAKLFIRYVLETKSPGQMGAGDAKIKSPDERGENIINTELEILTSLDLAQEVVTNITAEKILAKAGGGANSDAAAALVRKNVLAEVPKKSNVIRIVFQHPDPTIVQPGLKELIKTYLKRHAQIHRSLGDSDDFLSKETDQLRGRLAETEAALRQAKTNAHVISLEDTKKVFSEQMAKIQQAIFDAEAELAERQAAAAEMGKLLHVEARTTGQRDEGITGTATNSTASGAERQEQDPKRQGTGALQNLAAGTSTNQVARPHPSPLPQETEVAAVTTNNVGEQEAKRQGTGALQNLAGTTNQVAHVFPSNNPAIQASAVPNAVPSDKVAEYKRVSNLLETLGKKELELLGTFTPENSLVKSVQEQIAANEERKKQLEDENPGLLAVKVSETKTTEPTASPRIDLVTELARVIALESKIKVLTGQLEKIRKQATVVDEMEGSITELQRKKELEEAHYKYFSASLEQSRIDEALGAGRVSNISIIQAPSPPFRENLKQRKLQAMALFGSIAAAIALAFLLELYFDRSLKRPIEVETRLGLPLFVCIPMINGNGKPRFLKAIGKIPLLAGRSQESGARSQEPESPPSSEALRRAGQSGEGEEAAGRSQESGVRSQEPKSTIQDPAIIQNPSAIIPHASSSALRPFHETLRDRLISFFELKNLIHKPKLVAMTSCGEGAGVTTTAAGLASCLSETGDGNVLLVDMNLQQGAAHHFYRGALECGLDDALENGKRHTALVQDNLYVVSESTNGDRLPRVLPKRFKHLVPKLKASDYDYIIFDMPPVSQISATPRLARYMDMVFLVVESEKTDRDVVKRAADLLAESKANLGVILNKARTYVPKQLQQDL